MRKWRCICNECSCRSGLPASYFTSYLGWVSWGGFNRAHPVQAHRHRRQALGGEEDQVLLAVSPAPSHEQAWPDA